MRLKILLAVLPLLGLIGCSSFKGPSDSSLKFNPDGGTGIIVVSATLAKTEAHPDYAQFHFGRPATKEGWVFRTADQFIPLPTDNAFPDDDKLSGGRVFAFELAPGDYQMTSWLIKAGRATIYPGVALKPIPFTVEAGTVTYLGSFHMDMVVEDGPLGIVKVVAGGRPSITDRSDRDLPLIRSRYPGLSSVTISSNVLNASGWGNTTQMRYLAPVTVY